MDVLIIGSYPPPVGGNTVHIQRLLSFLVRAGHRAAVVDYLSATEGGIDKGANVTVLPPGHVRKLRELVRIALRTKAETVVHFHVSALNRFKWVAPLLLLLFRRQPKVITIHSGSFIEETSERAIQIYLKWLCKSLCHIITVSVEQSEHLAALGVPAEKLSIIPAFLPQHSDPARLPASVAEGAAGGKTLVLTSGYLTSLYNYDVLIDCIARLDRRRYCFVFAFYNERDAAYEQHIEDRLAAFDNVVVLRDQPSEVFVTIVERSDIYVRTTLTDGDAVAIREAQHFGKTVFASDCVARPAGCVLFPTSDSEALFNLFQVSGGSAGMAPAFVHASNADRIVNVYQRVQSAKRPARLQAASESSIRTPTRRI